MFLDANNHSFRKKEKANIYWYSSRRGNGKRKKKQVRHSPYNNVEHSTEKLFSRRCVDALHFVNLFFVSTP